MQCWVLAGLELTWTCYGPKTRFCKTTQSRRRPLFLRLTCYFRTVVSSQLEKAMPSRARRKKDDKEPTMPSLQFPVLPGSVCFGRALKLKLFFSTPYSTFYSKSPLRLIKGHQFDPSFPSFVKFSRSRPSSIKMPLINKAEVLARENSLPSSLPVTSSSTSSSMSGDEENPYYDREPLLVSSAVPVTMTTAIMALGPVAKPKTIITGSGGVLTNGVPKSKNPQQQSGNNYGIIMNGNGKKVNGGGFGIRKTSRTPSPPELAAMTRNLYLKSNGVMNGIGIGMENSVGELGRPRKIYKVVLTGGKILANYCSYFSFFAIFIILSISFDFEWL